MRPAANGPHTKQATFCITLNNNIDNYDNDGILPGAMASGIVFAHCDRILALTI